MKKRVLIATICLSATIAVAVSAQRPADAPATAPAGKAPDSVFIEDLTWAEVRDLIAAGTTNVIIGIAGTEQKGPHMVDGEHKFVMEWSADKIARQMGKTLVAPVVTYVPEGSWENIGGHMAKPGTITLPEDRFVDLLRHCLEAFHVRRGVALVSCAVADDREALPQGIRKLSVRLTIVH